MRGGRSSIALMFARRAILASSTRPGRCWPIGVRRGRRWRRVRPAAGAADRDAGLRRLGAAHGRLAAAAAARCTLPAMAVAVVAGVWRLGAVYRRCRSRAAARAARQPADRVDRRLALRRRCSSFRAAQAVVHHVRWVDVARRIRWRCWRSPGSRGRSPPPSASADARRSSALGAIWFLAALAADVDRWFRCAIAMAEPRRVPRGRGAAARGVQRAVAPFLAAPPQRRGLPRRPSWSLLAVLPPRRAAASGAIPWPLWTEAVDRAPGAWQAHARAGRRCSRRSAQCDRAAQEYRRRDAICNADSSCRAGRAAGAPPCASRRVSTLSRVSRGHQVGGGLGPAGHRPLHRRVTAGQSLALHDRAEGRGDVLAPPRVAAARRRLVRGRQRLEAGRVADLFERGQERDGEPIGLEQAVAQIVEREAAVPRGERLVHRAAHRAPFLAALRRRSRAARARADDRRDAAARSGARCRASTRARASAPSGDAGQAPVDGRRARRPRPPARAPAVRAARRRARPHVRDRRRPPGSCARLRRTSGRQHAQRVERREARGGGPRRVERRRRPRASSASRAAAACGDVRNARSDADGGG